MEGTVSLDERFRKLVVSLTNRCRAIIEEDYAKRLAKLAKMTLGRDEIGYVLFLEVLPPAASKSALRRYL